MKIGDIDLIQQGLNNEYQIARLTKILDRVISRSGVTLSKDELEDINDDVVRHLQEKYPNSGIARTEQGAGNAGR